MSFLNIFKKTKKEKNKNYPLYCYDDGEIDEIEKCIEEKFGAFKEVFHEIFSPDIHLDVCFVEPTESEPYYKLVTMGAGAYKMKVPKNLEQYDLECAEYVINIPKEWNFKSDNINDYWPTKALKDVARLPVMCDTWLGCGHTVQGNVDGSAYAQNTGFNSVILDYATKNDEIIVYRMSSGRVINFYQIYPLYPEELKFKFDYNAEMLFNMFDTNGVNYKVLDVNRRNIFK